MYLFVVLAVILGENIPGACVGYTRVRCPAYATAGTKRHSTRCDSVIISDRGHH